MKAHAIGRFVRDPELRQVGETHVCEFSLAVDEHRRVGGERRKYTNFLDFVIWDKAAELVVQHKRKGDLIAVDCTARQDKWQDSNGNNRSKVVFRVDDFQFLPRYNHPQGSDEGTNNTQEAEVEEPAF